MNDTPFPSVGDLVHFVDEYAAHRAAIVIHVNGSLGRLVWLRVFGIDFADREEQWVDQGDAIRTWHWPD